MIDFENGSVFKLAQTNIEKAEKLVHPLMVGDEKIISAYKSVRDLVVFTNKRVIAVNVEGVTGKKKDFTSLPYAKVQAFSELQLHYSNLGTVIFEFSGRSDMLELGRVIGEHVL